MMLAFFRSFRLLLSGSGIELLLIGQRGVACLDDVQTERERERGFASFSEITGVDKTFSFKGLCTCRVMGAALPFSGGVCVCDDEKATS